MDPEQDKQQKRIRIGIIVGIGLAFVIAAILAAYMSWSCNTKLGYSLFEKIIYGIAAFSMNFVYLAYFLWYRMDLCHYCGGPGPSLGNKTPQ